MSDEKSSLIDRSSLIHAAASVAADMPAILYLRSHYQGRLRRS